MLTGEHVRVLTIFARARCQQPADEGWLNTADAYELWQLAGGNKESSADRLSWDCGKIRSQLVQRGLLNATELFERTRKDKQASTRLSILPENIFISD